MRNRIRSTLQDVYARGFRERMLALKRTARSFAAVARWSEEDASWVAGEGSMERLMTAAFEIWNWDRIHGDADRISGRVYEEEVQLFKACLALGDACHANKPGGRQLVALLNEAVCFNLQSKGQSDGRTTQEG